MPPLLPYANIPMFLESATNSMQATRSPVIVKNYSLDSIARELAAAKIQAQSQEKPGVIELSALNVYPFVEGKGISHMGHSTFNRQGQNLEGLPAEPYYTKIL